MIKIKERKCDKIIEHLIRVIEGGSEILISGWGIFWCILLIRRDKIKEIRKIKRINFRY